MIEKTGIQDVGRYEYHLVEIIGQGGGIRR